MESIIESNIELEVANSLFNEDIKAFTPANADRIVLKLGNPSNILLSVDIEDKPLKLYGSKLMSKINKHGFSAADLVDLPKAVANPIAIFKGSVPDSFSILTELKIGSNNVLVSLGVGRGQDIDFNIISSTYGKSNSGVVHWINNDDLRYTNKQKTLNYLNTSDLISDALTNSEFDSAKLQKKIEMAKKKVENFVNPKLLDKKNQKNTNTMETKNTQTTEQKLAKNLAPEQFEEFKEILMSSEYMARFGYDNDILGWNIAMDAINEATTPQEVSDNLNKALGYDEEDFIDAEDLQKYIAQTKENVDQSPSLEEMIGNYFYGNDNSNNIVMELGLDLDSAAAEEVHIRLESYKEDYDQTVTMADYEKKRAEQNQMIDSASKTIRSIAAQENLNVSNAIDEALTEKNNTNLKNLNTMETKKTTEEIQPPTTAVETAAEQTPVEEQAPEQKKEKKNTVGAGAGTTIQKADDVSESFVQNFWVNFMANLKAKRKSQSDEFKTKVNPMDVDWGKLKKQGVKIKDLSNKDLENLVDGKKTGLVDVYKFVNGERQQAKAKISIGYNPKTEAWDKIQLNYHNMELKIDKYFSHTFTEEDKKNLLETGNLGRKIDIVFKEGQEPQPRFISVDFDTNEVVSKPANAVKLTDKFMGKDLTLPENQQLKADLQDGKRVFVKDLQYGEHKVDSEVQYNAAKGQFDFALTEESQKKISLDRITKEMTMFNVAGDTTYRYRNAEFSENEVIKLSQGEMLHKPDFKKKDGTAYAAFVKYDFDKGALQQISKHSMESSKTQNQAQQEVQQPQKSKGVGR